MGVEQEGRGGGGTVGQELDGDQVEAGAGKGRSCVRASSGFQRSQVELSF